MRTLNRFADRLLTRVAPRTEAAASRPCGYYTCAGNSQCRTYCCDGRCTLCACP